MPGIFISHSSIDKPFVNKLSLDLVTRGFPVWYDSWEISLADSLMDKIYSALDESFFLLVVLSKNSVESKWVTKELNAALAKEDELNRKFVLPIKIDDCKVPLKILDRIFLDLSGNYLKNVETLDTELRKWNVHKIDVPGSKRLIPLSFIKYIDVDTNAIEKGFKNLPGTTEDRALVIEQQLVVLEEPLYKKLKDRFYERIDQIENDPYYSAELHNTLKDYLDNLKKYEHKLREGVCEILNNYGKSNNYFYLNDSLQWFCKLMRSKIMYLLYAVQIPGEHNTDLIIFDSTSLSKWSSASLTSDTAACIFFEVEAVNRLYIGDAGLGYGGMADFSFWMGEHHKSIRDFLEYHVPESAASVLYNDDLSKYVIPQMLLYEKPEKYIWALENKVVALS